jgi:tetratricopeptide (TPR) repeat protein
MQNENINIGDKVNEFIQRNRKVIFTTVGLLVFLFIGLIVFLSLQDISRKKAISEVEELNRRYEDLRFLVGDDYYTADFEALLADLNAFANNKGGFSGSRAWSIIALIHSGREEWPQAENAWLNAARAGTRTYLGPLSLFNAAVAAEEQGKLHEAIELLERCLAHPFEFPAAARAQFAIGRLYEELNDYPAAIEAYRAVLINWQDIPVWQHLARSKIIAIEVK